MISWDVRAFGRKGFYIQVKDFIPNYNLDILALIQTKVNASRTHKIIQRINLPIVQRSLLKVSLERSEYFGKTV